MLTDAWMRRRIPGAIFSSKSLAVYGDTAASRLLARGGAQAGLRISSHDLSALQGTVTADAIIIDSGNERETLEAAAEAAARLSGTVIGVVVESWAGFTAALALDASLDRRGMRIRPLSMNERRARTTLAAHPWWRLRHAATPSTALIFGTVALTEHLVIALLRSMHLTRQTPQVLVVGADAPGWVASLQVAMPQLPEIGRLTGVHHAPGPDGVGILYATAASSDLAAFPPAIPLVWLADGEAPPQARPAAPPDWPQLAHSLFDDPGDARAEAIHAFYFEAALRDGNAPGSRPSMLPWAKLPERFRQASRDQADHVPAKLAAIGCREAATPERRRFRFSGGEVDALARVEHERWSAVQRLEGWTYGAVREDAARRTPFLRPYDELAPEIQDRDRMPVRQIPAQLARIGHGVQRDAVVTLSADAAAGPGFAFGLLFRGLLADIARRYPDRCVVLASRLSNPLERRAAEIALARTLPLRVLLPPDLAIPPQAETLLPRAESLQTVFGSDIAALGALHIHIGGGAPAARRLVRLDSDGRVQAAPWL